MISSWGLSPQRCGAPVGERPLRGLEVRPEKTRLRFAERAVRSAGKDAEHAAFDGFTHYCRTQRNGRFGLGRKPRARSELRRSTCRRSAGCGAHARAPKVTGRCLAGAAPVRRLARGATALRRSRGSRWFLRRLWLRVLHRRSRGATSPGRLNALCRELCPASLSFIRGRRAICRQDSAGARRAHALAAIRARRRWRISAPAATPTPGCALVGAPPFVSGGDADSSLPVSMMLGAEGEAVDDRGGGGRRCGPTREAHWRRPPPTMRSSRSVRIGRATRRRAGRGGRSRTRREQVEPAVAGDQARSVRSSAASASSFTSCAAVV